jgi:uncharacterized membrane protein
MILFVKEFNLVRKLPDCALVRLVRVLDRQSLQVCTALVEVVQPFNLFVPDVHLLLELSKFVFDLSLAFLYFLELKAEPVATLVSLSKLLMPLLIGFSIALLGTLFFLREESALRHIVGTTLVDGMTEFELLQMAPSFSHNVKLASLKDVSSQVLDNLILRRQVHLGHSLLKL